MQLDHDKTQGEQSPAFPVDTMNTLQPGLTKREFFAGQMMAAILSHTDDNSLVHEKDPSKIDGAVIRGIAMTAVLCADHLLSELS